MRTSSTVSHPFARKKADPEGTPMGHRLLWRSACDVDDIGVPICSGWFTEWYEWGKSGTDVCALAHIFLAKRGLKLVRLS
jgi:hypothetical protein